MDRVVAALASALAPKLGREVKDAPRRACMRRTPLRGFVNKAAAKLVEWHESGVGLHGSDRTTSIDYSNAPPHAAMARALGDDSRFSSANTSRSVSGQPFWRYVTP